MGIKHPESSYLRAYYICAYKALYISRESSTNPPLFMPNKAKVKYVKLSLSSFITSKYVICGHLVIQKTNPIQTQFKAKQSQLKPFDIFAESPHFAYFLHNIRPIEQAEVGNSRADSGIKYPDSHLIGRNCWYPADSLVTDCFSLSNLMPFAVNIGINSEFGNSLTIITDLFLKHYAIESLFSI